MDTLKKLSIPLFTIFMIFLCAALAVLSFVPGPELSAGSMSIWQTFLASANTTIVTVAGGLVLVTVAGVIVALWHGLTFSADRYFVVQTTRAGAIKAHNEADLAAAQITVAPPGSQVYVTETGYSLTHKPLHLAAGNVNGGPVGYTELELSRWQAYQILHATARPAQIEPGHHPLMEQSYLPAPEAPRSLLDLVADFERLLIVGPSKAGKTTILQHLVNLRQRTGQVLVVTPHADGSTPVEITVGGGRDFEECCRVLRSIVYVMSDRYGKVNRGLARYDDFEPITLFVDEWRALIQWEAEQYRLVKRPAVAGNALKTLLVEARKTRIYIAIVAHSKNVKALGVEGEGDLRHGFLVVNLAYNQVDKTRSCEVEFPGGQTFPASHPGPFHSYAPPRQTLLLPEPPTDEEIQVIELIKAGQTDYAICGLMNWKRGQSKYTKIQEIREKFGPF